MNEQINIDNNGNVKFSLINTVIEINDDIDNCRNLQRQIIQSDNNKIVISKLLYNDNLKSSLRLLEEYTKSSQGLHCDITIQGVSDGSWSMPILSSFRFITNKKDSLRYWTAWGSPNIDTLNMNASLRNQLKEYKGGCDAAKGWAVLGGEHNNRWVDPLVPVSFSDSKYYYGATGFQANDPMTGFVPAQNDLFAIPMAVIIDEANHEGYSIILSLKDIIIDLEMETKKDGTISFKRLWNRISQDSTLHFSYDIIRHSDDWRSGIETAYKMYPEYFEPKNDIAYKICGTGSYSASKKIDNAEKLRAMAFGVNWQASFDFPYMGMFIPPVEKNEAWETFGFKANVTKEATQTLDRMNKISKEFKDNGFYSLSYFNVCEFGTGIVSPPPATMTLKDKEAWKDANEFLYRNLYNAILPMTKELLKNNNKENAGYPVPYGTWGGAVAMDCGDSAYSEFLIDQAQKHIEYLPDSYGICIDRLDWLRMFNDQADDKMTWYSGRPARSLYNSWKTLMKKLGPTMHNAGKVIFVNNHTRRIDLLNEVDGIFDEFTYMGNSMNLMALNCFFKPALGWVDIAKTIENEGGDQFIQRHLYMGVFPMCPFLGNDHSIRPSTYVDKYYLDYGKMMQMIKGRKWVLIPDVIKVENNTAKANIFQVEGGYVVPVVLGENKNCRVIVRGIGKIHSAKIYYPGEVKEIEIRPKKEKGKLIFDVPLVRNCAFIKIEK
ncbi:MAG: hypothetical protein PHR45_07655 [Muribaculaceae bacterium]|nr:hypothetical protein [Muribaculaceae bacterium]